MLQVATPSGDSSQLPRKPSDDGRAFCELFFLPLNEKPIAGMSCPALTLLAYIHSTLTSLLSRLYTHVSALTSLLSPL